MGLYPRTWLSVSSVDIVAIKVVPVDKTVSISDKVGLIGCEERTQNGDGDENMYS